ncbi:MAG TPA: hypothetical protein VFL41_03705 [Gaiellaceae bacterium]|nr:hypothetical protein [Gaiellaceae bacterium]
MTARVAAYTASEPGIEAARVAAEHDVDLLLVEASAGMLESGRPAEELTVILERAPCDVGVLVGTEADPSLGRRDASRLLAGASLLVQQVVGIVAEPVLVRRGEEGVLEGACDACLLVIGLSERWRREGIGPARLAVAGGTRAPTLFVRRGLRPSGVAPRETVTRFTWTLGTSVRADAQHHSSETP